HVADPLSQLERLFLRIEAENRGPAARGWQEAQKNADERALAGAVRADEADDAWLEVDSEGVERRDCRVALGDFARADQRHACRGSGGGTDGTDDSLRYATRRERVSMSRPR